jgi:hypothetical protein
VSSTRSESDDRPPESFAIVPPPPPGLSDHRSTIAYELGQLTTHVKYLSDGIRDQGARIDKLAESTSNDLKEQKSTIDKIAGKILVAETQVKSAFYTSKWFIGLVCLVVGSIITNWSVIGRILQIH